ncbi:nicotinate-nucleotide--dimethylbenzimidazole phosphoribosyltransferase [Andreesenia angusta]|uniref:Nicotinate-nucleotide--dimethylbenzimidazole phosphoribosyltransferase n=1 Tax=Andreesenia angusta TaxID=39480 RepID=A0A1S1V5G7_9FIRM|nr:nicotinate-nucleotide--dimethylbenzimidazole phosphoribosyltransferase [Andreesenia angusta]OHW61896.1 nicotinate-nucleotide--dimethylbenzimidazole phosphoribosyltransferase [Andreesenia angusta]
MNKLDTIIEKIVPADESAKESASARVDSLIKPIGSLGRLEDLAVQLAGITGRVNNSFEKKCTVVMSSDNGVVEEGVASSPQEITAMQTVNMLKGITGISVLSKAAGSDIRVVDIGVKSDLDYPGLLVRKIKHGTDNMAKGPAMTRDEAIASIEAGIEIVEELVAEGYSILGTGEMGIGNTSTSSAVAMVLTGCGEEAIGKGAGLDDEAYRKKKEVISNAISLNRPDSSDPIDVLSKVGGLDIGGLTGCFLGAAYHRIPVFVDGVISAVAALLACRLNPNVKGYILPSHISMEPAYRIVMEELGLRPFLDMDMRLGEGSGCPMGFQIVDMACAMMNNMATFDEISLSDDFLVDIR